jgi:hypothetical protein
MRKRSLEIIIGTLALTGCNPAADTKAADAGVVAFHQAMDAGRYGDIYDRASPEMKTSMSREEFIKFLAGLHGKLGAFQSGATTNWNDNSTTSGHYLSLERSAKFERGPATEDFVFRIDGAQARLAGYHINSNALITG